VAERLHPDDRERVLADERFEAGGTGSRGVRLLAKDGSVVWVPRGDVSCGTRGQTPVLQGIISDVTQKKRSEERLHHLAFHDPLTGLPNRRLFVDHLGHALKLTRRQGNRVAVLFMDLDQFKVVNDSLGHEVGDLLLTVVAQRLGRCLRPEDTLARFGGDEFVVLLEAVGDPAEAVRVAERITEELRRPFVLEEGSFTRPRASASPWATPGPTAPTACSGRPTRPCTGPRPRARATRCSTRPCTTAR
jgi:diguanylate cyclase (GGDEF)-like protein